MGGGGGCYSLVFFTPFYHGPEGARPSQCLYRKHRWPARRCGAGTGVHGNVNAAGARDSRCVRRLPYAVYQKAAGQKRCGKRSILKTDSNHIFSRKLHPQKMLE
ncbi:hypothetical protein VULLAG_LOCUS270 [Vulpes lagopus]